MTSGTPARASKVAVVARKSWKRSSSEERRMKNVQVIDGAENCTYSLFAVTERDFALLFPDRQDVAFIDEILSRMQADRAEVVLAKLWSRPVLKSAARGIHGTLFYELNVKKRYYPTRKEVEVDSSSINRAQRKLFEKVIATEQARARVRKKVLARPKKKPGSSYRARGPRA